MHTLYWSVAPLPPPACIPALRARLEDAFPGAENRTYLAALAGETLPARVAVARLCALSLLPPLLARAGVPTQAVRLFRDEHGRPYGIPDSVPLSHGGAALPLFDFNLSHSDGHAVCALLTGGGRVGVDTEEPIPPRRALPLIRRYCTEGELRLLQGLSDEEAAAVFTRLWTIREALCKQDGRGMPLRYDAAHIPSGVSIRSGLLGSDGTRITLCYPHGVTLCDPHEPIVWDA